MKKKVLHVLSSNEYSGAENVATNIIASLSEVYDMTYVSPKGAIKTTLAEREIRYIPLEKLSVIKLMKIIKREKPDIIHAHDFTATIISLVSGLNIPVVSHIHQNPKWLNKINIRSIMFLIASLKINQLIVVTPAITKSKLFFRFLNKKTTIIENMVDLSLIRKKANIPTDLSYDIIFLGRLVDVKDPVRFINIMSKVIEKRPSTRVAIIGEGNLKKESKELIKTLNLEDKIDLLGFLPNPFPVLANSKVLCMTSKSEGLPMTILESFTLGKPVVVPALEGVTKVVDEKCGIVCKTDNEFVKGLVSLLVNDELYKSMSICGKENAEELFNIKNHKEKFVEVYAQC